MDTFAAFALATEPPLDSILAGPPFKPDANVLLPEIWRQIFGVSLWNILVMTLVIVAGPSLWGLEYAYSTSVNDSPATEASKNKIKHLTMLYNTFIFLQVFNEINCRKIGRRDFNVFENIHGNLYFLAVVAGTFAAQFIIVNQYSGIIFPTTALVQGDWGTCVALGATPLAIAAALKLTPAGMLEKVGNVKGMPDENDSSEPSGALNAVYEKVKSTKVEDLQKPGAQKQGKRTPDGDDDFHPL